MKEIYQSFPYSWYKTPEECPRDYQFLFNQRVEVIQEEDDQVLCTVPNALTSSPKTCYILYPLVLWTLKENVIPLETLSTEQQNMIPPTINAHSFTTSNDTITTLTMPWFNPIDQQIYSAGTRFVRTFNDTQTALSAAWYDIGIQKTQDLLINRATCYIHSTAKPMAERQQDMLTIIKQWIENKLIIPYVWGGFSIGRSPDGAHVIKQNPIMGKSAEGWEWTIPTATPHHGVDCSALILLAAQIVELPYFYRNTKTLERHLVPLQKNEPIKDGDLIWIPGHVMIISDSKNGLITESRGYGIKAGGLCYRTIADCFNNFNSIDDLIQAFFAGTYSEYRKRDGTIYRTPFKILKFSSIYCEPVNQ